MHAYLGTGIPRQLAKDLWVIDENIFSEYRQARVIGQADLDFTSSIVNRALNTAHERTGEEGISYARTIFLGLQEHLGLVQQGKTGGEFPYNVSALAWEVIHDNYEGNDEHPKGKLVVRDVCRLLIIPCYAKYLVVVRNMDFPIWTISTQHTCRGITSSS